ncbi:MAG: FAD-dependent oxidoreductase [Pseudomonadota bacterium]
MRRERGFSLADKAARAEASAGFDRRRFTLGAIAAASALAAPALAQAQAQARIVVVGGGAAGATAARRLARDAPGAQVTLVADREAYTSCFFSNLYLAGFRSLRSLTHRYDALAQRYGVRLVIDRAVDIDRDQRQARLASGARLPYDRLILAPGVSLQTDAIEGYGAVAQAAMPHGYEAGYQTFLLKKRLKALPEGGVFLIAAPPNPYRSPPAPYERASMAALHLSRTNPTAKVLILDAKDAFEGQALFTASWERYFPGVVEWSAASLTGGGVISVDAAAGTATTGAGDAIRVDAACIIPPQQAGAVAMRAGLTDAGGWAPVSPETMRSQIDARVFVIGDAARMEPMPKSAASAALQARRAAWAIRRELGGAEEAAPALEETSWSFLERQDAIEARRTYAIEAGALALRSEASSALEEDASERLENALAAALWYRDATAAMFS